MKLLYQPNFLQIKPLECKNPLTPNLFLYVLMEVSQIFVVKEVTGCGAPSPYKQPFVGMLVPFGAGEGVGMFNGFHIPSFVGTKLKYADLFTGQFWKTAGLKVPQ